ncbi:MAG: hypothetical protein E7381_01605 [Clostridiales bacterium]|nr:hypothetical protein [Clostridiales bacterium]
MLNQDYRILKFLTKQKKDRVKYELVKNRQTLLYKFNDVERYFNLSKIIKDLTDYSMQEVFHYLKQTVGSLKKAYILSTNDDYDGQILDFNQEILGALFAHGFPSVVLFNDGYMFLIGEYVMGAYSPKYLLKSDKN